MNNQAFDPENGTFVTNEYNPKNPDKFRQVELPPDPPLELNIVQVEPGRSVLQEGDFQSKNFSPGKSGYRLRENGNAQFNDVLVTGLFIVTTPIEQYTSVSGGTVTLLLAQANDHRIQMPAGNITIAVSNVTIGQKFLVSITQDSVGVRTVTWFSTIRWVDNSVPVLTTIANRRDTFGFICTGVNTYDGFIIGQNI